MEMVQTGDSRGEHRGIVYRSDVDLKAWLAKRPGETALEPDLPIIDPHHHFWDMPHRGHYLLPELLADIGSGHTKCPNVNIKLGGIGMTSFGFDFHERDVPPSSEELAAA
jgi:hypothetical protein